MNFYLQMGWGMMSLAEELTKVWGSSVSILSPRDLTLKQLIEVSSRLKKINGEVLFDPQFYLPRADHEGLINHCYWPKDFSTAEFSEGHIKEMLTKIITDYDEPLNTKAFILPGCYTKTIDDHWKNFHSLIVAESTKLNIQKPRYATISLSYEILQSESQIQNLVDYVEDWDIDGFYIIPEHPRDGYLVEEPLWLTNLMDLCAALKMQNKTVIVGYCSHQSLCLALSKVDAIASGTFLNVRSFSLDKFHKKEEGGGNRSIWYYCPQALSEFQLGFLNLAQRVGILDLLKTDNIFKSNESEILFSGSQPTDTAFKETQSFRHYLKCLKVQTENASRNTYKETLDSLNLQLVTAQQLLEEFHQKGVRGKDRDFINIADVNLGAISAFDNIRGFTLNRVW